MAASLSSGPAARADDSQPEGLGDVHFPTSCSAAAQLAFDRAVALLHSFWRVRALDAFARVAEMDGGCGIAYWGIAVATLINPFGPTSRLALQEGRAALERARAVGASTERERDYIAAIGAYYGDSDETPLQIRRLAYEQAMEDLHTRYPDDSEAAIFYALSLVLAADPTDKTYAKPLKAVAILEPLFAVQPDHPGITHYLIHAYDYPPLAARGLDAARRYAGIAPSVPHALHMPSHIFTQAGLWDESIATNRASAVAGPGEARHPLDYMIYGYLQQAQDLAAEAVVVEANAPGARGPAFNTAAIPARYAIERGQWASAVDLTPVSGDPGIPGATEAQGITYFARALGAARSGDLAAARENVALLGGLPSTREVEGWRDEAEAWLALAEGRKDEALQLMRWAADREDEADKSPVWPGPILPARELLGELLLELGDPRAARLEFEASLRSESNRFRGIYGAAMAAELSGDRDAAAAYYAQLLELASRADTDRPELQHARAFLAR